MCAQYCSVVQELPSRLLAVLNILALAEELKTNLMSLVIFI